MGPRWTPECQWLKWMKENIGDEEIKHVKSRCGE